MRSARSIYRLNVALATLAGLGVVLGMAMALRGIDLGPAPTERLASYCRRFLLPDVAPGGLAALGLGLLGAAVIVLALRSAERQLRGYRRFLRALEVVGERDVGRTRVLLTGSWAPEAFCAGLARPRIYLSRAALEQLTEAELGAVIAHEVHHAQRRDPLRIFVVRMLADALFFLPALRRLRERYEELAEIAADEAAVAAVGDPSPLAAALLRFGEHGTPGVVGIAPERVDHLLGSAPRWRLPMALLGGALITIAVLMALVVAVAHAPAAGRTSLVLLAAQSCMIVMAAMPVLTFGGLALLGRRALGIRRQ